MVNFPLIGLLYFESTRALNSPLLRNVKWSENEIESIPILENNPCHKINWQAYQINPAPLHDVDKLFLNQTNSYSFFPAQLYTFFWCQYTVVLASVLGFIQTWVLRGLWAYFVREDINSILIWFWLILSWFYWLVCKTKLEPNFRSCSQITIRSGCGV